MTTAPRVEHVRVAIIGAGPAGLTAAASLARTIDGGVCVLDREAEAGGIPRHSDHTGYGIRDLRRLMRGPAYARRLTDIAAAAGADIRTHATVTGWSGERRLDVTSPAGRTTIEADAVVLATGARERPRAARLIPGDRVSGTYTTGQLQNLHHIHHRSIGTRAVIVGAELVSWSAVLTLREAGCSTALMVSEHRRPESYGAFNLVGPRALRAPVATRSRVVNINGTGRVTSVDVEDLDTGTRRNVPCDTVITTGDWVPDNELIRAAGIAFDRSTRGPVVDTMLRTSGAGLFAAGNVIHPVETADIAAIDGRHVADSVRLWLAQPDAAPAGVEITTEAPLRWITPQIVRPGDSAPPRGRYLLWVDEHVSAPHVDVHQGGRVISSRRLPWPASPGRVFRIPARLFSAVSATSGPVRVTLR